LLDPRRGRKERRGLDPRTSSSSRKKGTDSASSSAKAEEKKQGGLLSLAIRKGEKSYIFRPSIVLEKKKIDKKTVVEILYLNEAERKEGKAYPFLLKKGQAVRISRGQLGKKKKKTGPDHAAPDHGGKKKEEVSRLLSRGRHRAVFAVET